MPLKGTVWGLPLALSVKTRLPEAGPAETGVKVSSTLHDPETVTEFAVEQVVPEAAIANGPVTPIAVKVRLALPVFVTVAA